MDQKQQEISPQNAPLEGQQATCGDKGSGFSPEIEKSSRQVFHCTNCDIDFFWTPTIVQGKTYCCTGCAAGGPCNCDYSLYRQVVIMGIVHYE